MLHYMPAVNEAISLAKHSVSNVVVVQRGESAAASVKYELHPGRDHDFHQMVASSSTAECVPLLATAPLYTIYTSGTTGDPKGILRDNSHAVTLKWSMTAYYGTAPGECFFAASDIGWVVGHSYIVYAPLLHGCTSIMFEGKPVGTPDAATCQPVPSVPLIVSWAFCNSFDWVPCGGRKNSPSYPLPPNLCTQSSNVDRGQ